MPLPLLPIAVTLLAGGSFWAGKKHLDKKKYTPERRMVFETAMDSVKDATKLMALADVFEQQGLRAQAVLLRKRARLRSLPQPIKDARRQAMAKAFMSKDITQLGKFADALDSETAYSNAAKIRAYMKTLQTGTPQGV
jgi:hypothetical protein